MILQLNYGKERGRKVTMSIIFLSGFLLFLWGAYNNSKEESTFFNIYTISLLGFGIIFLILAHYYFRSRKNNVLIEVTCEDFEIIEK